MKWLGRIVIMLSFVALPAVSVMAEGATPFATGIDATATYFDMEGNAEYEVSVSGIDRDWQEYDSFLAPEEGMEYVLLHLSITNLTAETAYLYPDHFELVDSLGMNARQAHMVENDDFWVEALEIDAGEQAEGTILFEMPADREPLMVTWKIFWNLGVFIYLGDA